MGMLLDRRGRSRLGRRLGLCVLAVFGALVVTAGSATGPARAQDQYVGEVFATAAGFCPRGTRSAEGQLFGVDERELGVLRELFWTHYGGDGRDNFALPDLRGPKDPNSWEHTFKPGELRWCIVLDRALSRQEIRCARRSGR